MLFLGICENNFLAYDILDVFSVQIEFLEIFDKFPKIFLIEVAAGGGGWPIVVIGIFWSFCYNKYSLHMGILDSHGRDENILGVIFLPKNTIFLGILLQTIYQIWKCFHIPRNVKTFSHTKCLRWYKDPFGYNTTYDFFQLLKS